MAIVVPNEGEALALTAWVKEEAADLKLFATNTPPGETDTSATYTEADGGGYLDITLTNTVSGATWTITAGAPTTAIYNSGTDTEFVFTGTLTTNPDVYGYYLLGQTSTDIMWAEAFAATFTPTNNGDKITFEPYIEAA